MSDPDPTAVPGFYPAIIRLVDTGEELAVNCMDDIPLNREFEFLETQVKHKAQRNV